MFPNIFNCVPLHIHNYLSSACVGNFTFRSRANHVNLMIFYILENVCEGNVSIHYMPTKDNVSSLGSKFLSRKRRRRHLIGLTQYISGSDPNRICAKGRYDYISNT